VEPTPLIDAPLVVLRINRTHEAGMSTSQVYDVARGPWRVGADARRCAKYAIVVSFGQVVGVYLIDRWSLVEETRDLLERRVSKWAFVGEPALEYVGLLGSRMRSLPAGSRSGMLKFLAGYPG
jgi:hypothetical protein